MFQTDPRYRPPPAPSEPVGKPEHEQRERDRTMRERVEADAQSREARFQGPPRRNYRDATAWTDVAGARKILGLAPDVPQGALHELCVTRGVDWGGDLPGEPGHELARYHVALLKHLRACLDAERELPVDEADWMPAEGWPVKLLQAMGGRVRRASGGSVFGAISQVNGFDIVRLLSLATAHAKRNPRHVRPPGGQGEPPRPPREGRDGIYLARVRRVREAMKRQPRQAVSV